MLADGEAGAGALTPPVLVTGGTGTLGRRLVPRLRAAGREVRVLTRGSRADEDGVRYVTGDLETGDGVDRAVDGVSTIVHCAGRGKGDEVTTATLVRQASRAGVRHVVFISVVGADRVPMSGAVDRTIYGYYGSKLASERVVSGSGLPWTTLRATQFHDLILMAARALTKLPVAGVPTGRFQPIDADEVAARLVELALGAPAGMVPDVAGPKIYEATELVRGYLRAAGRRRPILPLRLPGRAARAVRDGALTAPEHATGRTTWEAFLSRVEPPRAAG